MIFLNLVREVDLALRIEGSYVTGFKRDKYILIRLGVDQGSRFVEHFDMIETFRVWSM